MTHLYACDPRVESELSYFEAAEGEFDTSDAFYAAAVALMLSIWNFPVSAERYIAGAEKRQRLPPELAAAVQECAAMAPDWQVPPVVAPDEAWSYSDDWNIREFVWRQSGQWRMTSWQTSA